MDLISPVIVDALIKLPTNAEESAILNDFKENNPFELLLQGSYIILDDRFDESIVTSAITVIPDILKPNIVRTEQIIHDGYFSLSENDRVMIKQAFFRGLMYENFVIRSAAARGIHFIAVLEYPKIWPNLFDDLFSLISTQNLYSHIGGIMAFEELLSHGYITVRYKGFNAIGEKVLASCLDLMKKEVDQKLKIVAVKCLIAALDTFQRVYSENNYKNLIIEAILISIYEAQDDEFHRSLTILLYAYISVVIHILTEEDVSEIFKALNQSADVENESRCLDFVHFWSEFARIESKESNNEEYTMVFSRILAPELLPFLFAIIETTNIGDLGDSESYTLAKESFECICSFALSAPSELLSYSIPYFQEKITSSTESHVIAALCAIQAITKIKRNDSTEEAIMVFNTSIEFIYSVFEDLLSYTTYSIRNIRLSSLAVLCDIVKGKKVEVTIELFHSINSVFDTLVSINESSSLGQYFRLLRFVFESYHFEESTNFLGDISEIIFNMFDRMSHLPILNSEKDKLLEDFYDSVRSYIHYLPEYHCQIIIPYYEQTLVALQHSINQERLRSQLFFVLFTIIRKLENVIRDYLPPLVDMLIDLLNRSEELICGNAIYTFAAIFGCYKIDSQDTIYTLFPFLINSILSENSSLIKPTIFCLSYIYDYCSISDQFSSQLIDALFRTLINKNYNPNTRHELIRGIGIVFQNTSGELFIDIRDQLIEITKTIQQDLKGMIKDDDPDTMMDTFCSLFEFYLGILRAYKYEGQNNPESFSYQNHQQFMDLVRILYTNNQRRSIISDSVLFSFVSFLKAFIEQIGRKCNIILNSRYVKEIYSMCLKSPNKILKDQADSFKKQYDNA